MQKYAFILGHSYLLSLAEIENFFFGSRKSDSRKGNLPLESVDVTNQALIAGFDEDLKDPTKTLSNLGGTVKIGKILKEIALNTSPEDLANEISEILAIKFEFNTTKTNYAISAYTLAERHEILLKRILNIVKKNLKNKGIKGRYVNQNFSNPNAATLKKAKTTEIRSEILVIYGQKKLYLGEVQAIQDFENYSMRDYNRPARDAKLGMLPPKLAQVMINLSGVNHDLQNPSDKPQSHQLIYDPFCGVGTILAEALLMGFKAAGSDISEASVDKSIQNLEWLKQNGLTQNMPVIFNQDATKISHETLVNAGIKKIDAIVTETYLGPPLRLTPYPDQAAQILKDVERLVVNFFANIAKVLASGTPVIIAVPAIKSKEKTWVKVNIADRIEQLGFKLMPILSTSKTPTLLYSRENQLTAREIYKFVKV